MDEERIKQAVLGAIERSVDARALASAVSDVLRGTDPGPRGTDPGPRTPPPPPPPPRETHASIPPLKTGTQRLLTRIVLGDILDDSILGARPQERTFPLRLFFSELGSLLASEAEEGREAQASELAFTLASGLNFFFRAPMEAEAKMRVGLEVSRQLYVVTSTAKLDPDLVAKASPLLAALMTNELERVKFEAIDHMKVFDSQLHERADGSDPTGLRIVRPASFLCRVAANNAIKSKAQVVT